MKKMLFMGILFWVMSSFGAEESLSVGEGTSAREGTSANVEGFVVKITPDIIKVQSPKNWTSEVLVTIQNDLFSSFRAQINDEKGLVLSQFNLDGKATQKVNLKFEKNQKYYFKPLSIPRIEVELNFGSPDYELR